MRIQRLELRVNDPEATSETKEKILTIPIKAGLPRGTRIVFNEEGDQSPSTIPADVIFITEDRPHKRFQRDGSNLLIAVDIYLLEALTGTTITIKTIDDRILRTAITSIVSPDYQKIIEGEGLPIADDPTSRGNLIISFKIEFPKYLPTQSKSYVKKAFEVTKVKDNKKEVEYLHPTTVFDNKRDCDL